MELNCTYTFSEATYHIHLATSVEENSFKANLRERGKYGIYFLQDLQILNNQSWLQIMVNEPILMREIIKFLVNWSTSGVVLEVAADNGAWAFMVLSFYTQARPALGPNAKVTAQRLFDRRSANLFGSEEVGFPVRVRQG